MNYWWIVGVLLLGCQDESVDTTTWLSNEATVIRPTQKHSHLTLAQQAHQDPKKSAKMRRQIQQEKEKRKEAYRKNMLQRKKQLLRFSKTDE